MSRNNWHTNDCTNAISCDENAEKEENGTRENTPNVSIFDTNSNFRVCAMTLAPIDTGGKKRTRELGKRERQECARNADSQD